MSAEETTTIHEYISTHDLINEVESITKKNWRGAGSRSTYYNAVAKAKVGQGLTLVEGLMLQEAQKLMLEHSKLASESAQLATA